MLTFFDNPHTLPHQQSCWPWGRASHCTCQRFPFFCKHPPWSPARVGGRPCQAGSHPHFPFPMPRSHVALRLPPLSPPRPTRLGLGALPGPLLGPESRQWRLLQDEETGSSPPMPEGGVSARLWAEKRPPASRPCCLHPVAQKQASVWWRSSRERMQPDPPTVLSRSLVPARTPL